MCIRDRYQRRVHGDFKAEDNMSSSEIPGASALNAFDNDSIKTERLFGGVVQSNEWIKENEKLKDLLDQATKRNFELTNENERLKQTVAEQKNWIEQIGLLNSDKYPDVVLKINENIKCYEQMQMSVIGLKQKLYESAKRLIQKDEDIASLKETLSNIQKELLGSDKGTLILEKESLENTLKQLIKEIDFLSTKNDKLLQDLQKKDFYRFYEETRLELERLRKEFDTFFVANNYWTISDIRLRPQIRQKDMSYSEIEEQWDINCISLQTVHDKNDFRLMEHLK
eukprot:TRINITY_DN1606_c0_g1_i12.p2 TRINITY_DN1606_c0_g1~~TRINITY_DN1606_c0_g1_i12.p2  ORF type:complete len:283 (+),score=80.53 TRINITY_DN1606_c0_g1_i12:103-951(+)